MRAFLFMARKTYIPYTKRRWIRDFVIVCCIPLAFGVVSFAQHHFLPWPTRYIPSDDATSYWADGLMTSLILLFSLFLSSKLVRWRMQRIEMNNEDVLIFCIAVAGLNGISPLYALMQRNNNDSQIFFALLVIICLFDVAFLWPTARRALPSK